jgi:hypothetical protein
MSGPAFPGPTCSDEPYSIVWLLDGGKHNETVFLSELTKMLPVEAHVVLVSSCTVYGDAGGQVCDEIWPSKGTR